MATVVTFYTRHVCQNDLKDINMRIFFSAHIIYIEYWYGYWRMPSSAARSVDRMV
jgi:hypothetical protein